ncbi:MAG TPA: GAF domain-containing protein [Candidatus Binatia bacterium]|nr:GAF domain-containing protein [Candidatus Binatia bacterium]
MDHFGQSLIDGLDDAVVVTDARLTVVAWNPAMEQLTGVMRSSAVGRPAESLLQFLREAGLDGLLARARGGEPALTEAHCTLAGRRAWLQARYFPWRDAQGQVAGVVGIHSDVSERRRRAIFVRAVEAVGQSLASSLDLNEVLDTIVEKALEVMGADAALVVSWDGVSSQFTVLRAAGRLSGEYSDAGFIPVGGGPISRAVLQGRTIFTPNMLEDPETWLSPERRAQVEREGFKAVASAPLRSKSRVHGALVVHYWTVRAFAEEDIAALRWLAEQAALAIENARVFADATRRADRLRELAEVEQLVSESLVVDDVLRRIASATARLLNAPSVQLWTADPAERVLRLQASYVEPGSADIRMRRTVAFGEGVSGRVADSKAPIYVDDVTHDARALSAEWARETGIQRMLSVPILAGDDLLGVLAVRSRSAELSSDENRALVVSLAARAAVALQNARSYADAVRRGGRLRDLVAVSRSISASLDARDVMQRIVAAAAAMRPGAMAAVNVFDEGHERMRAAAVSSPEYQELPLERAATAGLPGLVVEQHQPVLVPQPITHPRTIARAWWERRPRAAYYGVPIDVGETFVGVLDYIVPDGLPDREEQEAMRLLAAQAGVALRNAHLYQAERVQAERVRALAAVNQRISSSLELDELLRMISESAAQLTGVRFGSFWLADESSRTLTFVGGSNAEMADDFPLRAMSYDEGGIGWVARHRKTLVVDDVRQDSRVASPQWGERWGLRSFAAYPVIVGDQLVAVLSLSHTEPVRFAPDTVEVIEMFMGQASVAIQNARLYLEAQRRRDVAEVLARLGRELTGTLEVERIAALVASGLVDLLRVQHAVVFTYEPGDGTLHEVAASGSTSPVVRGVVLQPGEGIAGRAVAERKVLLTPDLRVEPRIEYQPEHRARLVAADLCSLVGVPLFTSERIIGALALADRTGREFTPDELQTLQAFADQAALAFENARLYATAQDSLTRLRETQAQLVQAAKMSALGQLVSGVAHELNNPLSVIIGYGQLLLSREVPAAMRRPVELMVAQGDRMAKIVRNLLFFARQRPPERAAVNLQAVIEQTLTLRTNQLTLSGISVETEFAPDLPEITGDAQQLEQVFLNLLLNAEQAILEVKSQGRILVRTRVSPNGQTIYADVVDDGPGIAPEAVSRVFEPFFTTKTVGSGTGLGLSVSYGILEEHGGKLSVQSLPGETVFTVELPVTRAPEPAPAPAPRRVAPSGTGRVALVVEDEPSVLDLVVTLLSQQGWRVDMASGGRTGLECVERRAYDLVVSDIRMPDGDGQEFYRNVLAREPALAKRFIFITGDTANPDGWRFLEQAGVPVIEKPFPPATFEEAVARVMAAAVARA